LSPLSPVIAPLLALAATTAVGLAQGNVLVIVADDLGVDRVAAYKEHHDPGRTPNIDRLAGMGLLFRNAWSNPVCSPTRAAIMTGRYSFRTLIGKSIHVHIDHAIGLSLSEVTIPELLPPGYRSAAIGKWHLSTAADGLEHPRRQGFDTFSGGIWNLGQMEGDYYRWHKVIDGERSIAPTYATIDTTNDAILQLESLPEPWFLYVAYHAPHPPIHAPPNRLHHFSLSGAPKDSPVIHTKASVEALDTELGRLLTHVNFDRTTVLFLGDNGTDQSASEAPFLPEHAKGTMYEGGLNVPLIVAGSGVAPGENTALVHAVDFFATVAELAGVPGTTQDSISMVPYLAGDPTPRREYVYSERFKPNGPGPYTVYDQAVRGLRYKLIRRVDGEELYDLMTDPFERNDLLRQPSLTAPQRAAYRRLDVELARILAS
jgi:arylsulfatase A-like enzyme